MVVVVSLGCAAVAELVGWYRGGGAAPAVRFWPSWGASAGSAGSAGLMKGGGEELRRLPKEEADGVGVLPGLRGGVYCVPASTVVLEEWVDVDNEVREAAMVGLDRPGNAAAGGRRM